MVWPSSGHAAGGSPAAPGKTVGGIPGYTIIKLGRGHNNRLCLAATVGGIKGLMLLDTGANGTALNESTYRSLLTKGSVPLPPGVPKTSSFNGVPVKVVMAPNFRIGASDLGSFSVRLVPSRYLYDQVLDRTADKDRNYDGYLGEELLRHCNAMVDCGRLVLYLNTGPVRKLSVDADFVNAGWTRVRMTDAVNDFTVPCTINGHHFRMLVDTGAPFTTVNRRLAGAAHLQSRDLPMLSGGLAGTRAEETGLVTVAGMQIGSYIVPSIHMITTPQSFSDFGGPHDEAKEGAIVGLLGGDALAANGAVVDIGNKVLYLKRATGGGAR